MNWRAASWLALSALGTALLFASLPASATTLAGVELATPRALSMLGLLPLIVWAAARRRRAPWTNVTMRCLALASLAAAVSEPRTQSTSQRRATTLLVDVSDSIDDASLARTERRIAGLCNTAGQPLTLVTFAGEATLRGNACAARSGALRHRDGSQSNYQSAIELALGSMDRTRLNQLSIFGDGLETQGSASAAAALAARWNVRIFYEAPAAAPIADLAVIDLVLPATIKAGEPFTLQARLYASSASQARVSLLRDGEPQPHEHGDVLSLPAGERTVDFRVLVKTPGDTQFRVQLTPLDQDRQPANDQLERSVHVQGKPRVLYVERERNQAGPLQRLLEAAGFDVQLVGPEGAPRSVAALRDVDFYLLSDVPHTALPAGAEAAIASYVDAGGGFMMAGGAQSFGLGGYRGSALAKLLPVRLEHQQPHEEPTLALTLVIDKSGSMSEEKIALAKEAARATAALLHEDDFLGVIGFDAAPTHVVRLAAARNRSAIERGIERLKAGGGTAIFPALDAAYADLSGVRAKKKHVLLLTDGQTREAGLDVLVQNMQLSDITLSTVGLGQDVSRKLLEELARLGHGRAYFTDDPKHVPRLFLHDTEAVSRTSTIEQRTVAQLANSASFLKGVNIVLAPPLAGHVSSSARAAPAQLVLQTQTGEPLLARMRVGLGWSLAFTSDLKPRWSASWFGWHDFSQLIAQLVREHMRHVASADHTLRTRREHDTIVAELSLPDAEHHFLSDLDGELLLRRQPDGQELQRVPLTLVAPGLYQARLPAPGLGSHSLEALGTRRDGSSVRALASLGGVLPDELRALPPDTARLAQLARATGGDALRDPAQLRRGGVAPSVPTARWPWCVWAALGCFMAELVLRRLAGRRRPLPASNPAA